jgi:YhcH/YjgK/YiaL family protein
MILDLLTHAPDYENTCPGLAEGFRYLRETDCARIAAGRYPIDGKRIHAIVQDYDTKPYADGFLEIHQRYIDIQFLVSGEELIGYAPFTGQPVQTPYNAEKDIAFLQGASDPVRLTPGLFAVFFPQDAHMPGRTAGASVRVRKVVVKVAVAGR